MICGDVSVKSCWSFGGGDNLIRGGLKQSLVIATVHGEKRTCWFGEPTLLHF